MEGENKYRVYRRCFCKDWPGKDLTVMVTLNSGETQNVLEGLTGYAEPGTFTALMGPSGSGKSTLLDALSGRLASNAFLSGRVLLNGRKANLSFGTAAYVTQDDTLIGTLTVRETISYSAQLRLPDRMPWLEKRTLIESTIIEMGLQDCADTVIGNWHLRDHFLRCNNSDFNKVKATLKGSDRSYGLSPMRILLIKRQQLKYTNSSRLLSSFAFYPGKRSMCIVRLWICDIHVNWRIPFFRRRYEEFSKERMNGHYGGDAFVVSNTLSAMPFLILITFLSGTVCYFMLMMVIASVVPNFLLGNHYRCWNSDSPMISQSLSGVTLCHTSVSRWALQSSPDLPKIPGEFILEQIFQIDLKDQWVDVSVIFVMIITYRIIFFIMIKINEDVTPWIKLHCQKKNAAEEWESKTDYCSLWSHSITLSKGLCWKQWTK
ncbi:hypothetical protein HAX54_049239 [Datura stramonium]|uniref:ABC transporter domain-containing protein n=1 Tax=Datura stramonium TaxID=4076 RepID=A0ABS8WMP4_DATST|nr:hypothetical protein [Datura stramonium]